ncbi:MAG: D-glycero-beta-D-manno-heptose 1-phosphate adenylyltransferase, partial [Firmicutes bacterium]|nr:D-glycero-beta-D-manno-heptose 1-phosphate adenylyltransferase [Bacillota bacterium]
MVKLSFPGKIKTLEELLPSVKMHRQEGKKLVFTNGCFDLLHKGHVLYLNQARALGDILIVGVNSDSSVRQLKEPGRPLIPQEERALLVAALEYTDYVVIFDEDRPDRLLEAIRPDIHVKGGDYTLDRVPEAKIVSAYGGQVILTK